MRVVRVECVCVCVCACSVVQAPSRSPPAAKASHEAPSGLRVARLEYEVPLALHCLAT